MGTSHSQRDSSLKSKSLPHTLRSSVIKPNSKTASTMQSRKTLNSLNEMMASHKLTESQIKIANKLFREENQGLKKRVSFVDPSPEEIRAKSENHIFYTPKQQKKSALNQKKQENEYFVQQKSILKSDKKQEKQKSIKINQPDSDAYTLKTQNDAQIHQITYKSSSNRHKQPPEYKVTDQRELAQIYEEKNPEIGFIQYQIGRPQKKVRKPHAHKMQVKSPRAPVIRHNQNQFGSIYR